LCILEYGTETWFNPGSISYRPCTHPEKDGNFRTAKLKVIIVYGDKQTRYTILVLFGVPGEQPLNS